MIGNPPSPRLRAPAGRRASYTQDDLHFALMAAADFLDLEEWPDPEEAEAQCAAYREAARRIRRMADRLAP